MEEETPPEAPAIIRSEHEAWLAERKQSVGCSELAALLGQDERRGALALYYEKTSEATTEEDASYLRLGNKFTTPICEEYGFKTGRPIHDRGPYTIVRNPDQPRLTATLDRETEGSKEYPAPALGIGPLEAKSLAWMKETEWLEEPPMKFLLQLQGQMGCTRATWGSLAALIGGIIIAKPIDVLRSDALLDEAYDAVEVFWWHVTNRVPPPADGLPETTKALKRAFPRAVPGQLLLLDLDDQKNVHAWDEARHKRIAQEHEESRLENILRARMGMAEIGRLPDHGTLFLRTSVRNPEACEKCGHEVRKGSIYRTPRLTVPEEQKIARRTTALLSKGTK